jgi:triosephosphate isomerase
MNGSLAALGEIGQIAAAAKGHAGVDVAICPPFTLIAPARARAAGLPIGAQDCHGKESGACTGSVSAAMLKEVGARLVIVGHSERRAEHRESNEAVRAKAEAALRQGLQVILCVGESDEERAAGRHLDIVSHQLRGSLPQSGEHCRRTVRGRQCRWRPGRRRQPDRQGLRADHRSGRPRRSRLIEEPHSPKSLVDHSNQGPRRSTTSTG